MDVEKMAAALASGDLREVLALADSFVTFNVVNDAQDVMVIGYAGTVGMHLVSMPNGEMELTLHSHSDSEHARTCFEHTAEDARTEAVQANAVARTLMGRPFVVETQGPTPDYIPGSWMTV